MLNQAYHTPIKMKNNADDDDDDEDGTMILIIKLPFSPAF